MADILQRTLDPRVAPGRILFRHPHDEPLDFGEYAATAGPTRGTRPLPRDEFPMPAQNRVGGDDRGDLPQPMTAQPMSVLGQSTTLLVGQPDPAATELRAEDTVLFEQI